MNVALIKAAATILSNIGAMRIVNTIVRANVSKSLLSTSNVCVTVASIGLASAAGDVASKALCRDIDTINAVITGCKKGVDNAKQQQDNIVNMFGEEEQES